MPNGIGSAILLRHSATEPCKSPKPWFQQEDQTGKLLSTTGSLGITNTCTKPAPYIIICYYRSFQSSTMLTGPEVLQCQCFILEPSVFIPGGGILEPSNLRVLKLAKSYKAVLLGTASKSSWWSAVATFHLKNLYILI